MPNLFHLSIPVRDLDEVRRFYVDTLGCKAGRVEADRIDLNFFGHHVVAQLSPEESAHVSAGVGRENYPLRHFGAIVPQAEFDRIRAALTAFGAKFVIRPETRHLGTPREQSCLFVLDPSGNGLEFKALADPQKVFSA